VTEAEVPVVWKAYQITIKTETVMITSTHHLPQTSSEQFQFGSFD